MKKKLFTAAICLSLIVATGCSSMSVSNLKTSAKCTEIVSFEESKVEQKVKDIDLGRFTNKKEDMMNGAEKVLKADKKGISRENWKSVEEKKERKELGKNLK